MIVVWKALIYRDGTWGSEEKSQIIRRNSSLGTTNDGFGDVVEIDESDIGTDGRCSGNESDGADSPERYQTAKDRNGSKARKESINPSV